MDGHPDGTVTDSGPADATAAPDAAADVGPDGTVVTLATGQPTAFTVDTGAVYWTDKTGLVLKTNVIDGSTSTIASGQASPVAIAVDAANVYWSNSGSGSIVGAPLDGGAIATIVSGVPNLLRELAVDTTNIYYTSFVSVNCGDISGCVSLVKAPLAGGSVTTLAGAGNLETITAITLEGADIFWAQTFGGGAIGVVPTAGGPVTFIDAGPDFPTDIFADSRGVYWSDYFGTLIAAGVDGGGATVVGESMPVFSQEGIAADSINIYWSADTTIGKTPLDGGTSVALATSPDVPALSKLCVDSTTIYWITSGAVMSTSK